MASSLSSALSSLEVMLDALMQRGGGGGGDDKSRDDVPPALPVRPTARGRLPSLQRIGAAADSRPPWNNAASEDIGGPLAQLQGRIIAQEASSQSLLNQEHEINGKASVILDFERRALKAEAALKQKEEEIAALKQQLEHYDAQWSEYELKMKSMEDKLQKQMASLQMSVAIASQRPAAAAAAAPNYSERAAGELNNYNDSDEGGAMANCQVQRAAGEAAVRQGRKYDYDAADDKQSSSVSHLRKEFRQQSEAFENGARVLRPAAGQSGPSTSGNAAAAMEELKKLKSQFVAWKKEYKTRLRQTKAELTKLVYLERGKARRKCWIIKCIKKKKQQHN